MDFRNSEALKVNLDDNTDFDMRTVNLGSDGKTSTVNESMLN